MEEKKEDKLDQKIYELRKKGMSPWQISMYFYKEGTKIEENEVRDRCSKIYKEKGEKKPPISIKKGIYLFDEEIYTWLEEGISYQGIVKRLRDMGIEILDSAIYKRCKYLETKLRKRREEALEEKLYTLKEQGLSCKEIVQYFNEKGIKVTYGWVYTRCKAIYNKKGEDMPNARKLIGISDEELYSLREQGMSYKEIVEELRKKGIIVSQNTISNRYKKICLDRGISSEDILKKNIKPGRKRMSISVTELHNLREQGMNYEQIAQYYKSRGIKVSDVTIAARFRESDGKNIRKYDKMEIEDKQLAFEELSELEEKKRMLTTKKRESVKLLVEAEHASLKRKIEGEDR